MVNQSFVNKKTYYATNHFGNILSSCNMGEKNKPADVYATGSWLCRVFSEGVTRQLYMVHFGS
jgi:hypothetical protein